MWRLWCKALGSKATSYDKESDTVAVIRTIILAAYMITNAAIFAGVVRHWNDNNNTGAELQIQVEVQESSR